MNIEKLVASYFTKKRSQSVKEKQEPGQPPSANKCYEPQNHPFQPMVNQMPKSIYRATTKTECSREEVIERLYTDRRSVDGRRTAQKLSDEEREFKENCTFQPKTNAHSRRLLKTQTQQQDPFNRLYQAALTKQKLSESLTYQSQLQDKQNYPFQPQTNYRSILNSETHNLKPIYQRLDQIVKEKRERMRKLGEGVEEREMREKPVISEISQKIVGGKEGFKKCILERVTVYIQERKKKAESEAAEHERNMLKQCTFKPQINSTIEIPSNFTTRQEQYLQRIQQKLTSRIVQNSFHPEINKISQILMRQERESETLEQKLNRLTSDLSRQDKLQQIERELYEECTFVPEINVISKCLAAQHVAHKCDHLPKEEEYEFKPKINKMSQVLAKQAKMRKSQSADFRDRGKEQVNSIKMEMEYEELKECTFRPKINASRPKPGANLAQVKGYESFAKKLDRINQLKQQQKQLRERLFNRQKNYKSRKSTTPVQFKLSQGYNTKQAIKQQIRNKFEKECTFKPQIISLR